MIEHLEEAGATPDLFSPDGFVAAQMIVQAVREGGDTVDGMIDALEGWTFDSGQGRDHGARRGPRDDPADVPGKLVQDGANVGARAVETVDAETVAPPVAGE